MRLFWRVYLWLFAAAMLAFLGAGLHANRSIRRVYRDQVAAELRTQADWMASEIQRISLSADGADIDRRCREIGRLANVRMTVILPDGRVLGDSDSNAAAMENHWDRPEIQEALAGRIGQSQRFSGTMRRTLSYLAVPVRSGGEIVAVVRVSKPLEDMDRALVAAYREVATGVLAAAGLFAVVAFVLVRRISRPLDDMRRAAELLADGALETRVAQPSGGAEMRSLARALNRMAEQLGARIETITRQRNELKAVLASMSEGVLAVDSGGRVLHLNAAAEQWLGLSAVRDRGRMLAETVRHSDLQAFVQDVLDSGRDAETEILLHGNRFLRLHGTALEDAAGSRIGALVVLTDTTRLKRLENMRQDFVANVSHELKTPITALRGCVDTLLDRDWAGSGEDRHFIRMMERQVDRLWAIVGDLLSLSRLEHDGQSGRIPLETGPIRDVLRRAATACTPPADARRISIMVECPEDLAAPINAPLLEQAVGNLIDNAVKYSAEGTVVAVSAGTDTGEGLVIQVRDEGPGIEQRHLPRLFERFYRVDQARSRELGGTGLGLAIVKHIAQAHGGTVTVESTPGRGSLFTIRIPVR